MKKWQWNFRYVPEHLFTEPERGLTYIFQFSIALCKDLEIARTISELPRKRELQKLKKRRSFTKPSPISFSHTQGNCVPLFCGRTIALVALVILLRYVMLTSCRSSRVFSKILCQKQTHPIASMSSRNRCVGSLLTRSWIEICKQGLKIWDTLSFSYWW